MRKHSRGGHGYQEGLSRKALYLDSNTNNPIAVPVQILDQWMIDRVSDPSEARSQLERNHYPVSMACLDELTSPQIEQIEELVCDSYHSNWIALIHRQSLKDKNLRRMIHDYFYDYHTLPLPSLENTTRLQSTLGHAYGIEQLRGPQDKDPPFEGDCQMIGTSEAMLQIFKQIRKIAHTDVPVLITGESGTGKELIAHALHERSTRESGPFIAVNCGALPDSLIHSELFGHEKGAYTGAHRQHTGRIEAANNGTIFLDEIGDLPLEQQTYLLRFLQEKTIERLGSTQTRHVDARVIAATHIELEELIKAGRFREDLFFRLNVLGINVPPVQERGEDITLLAQYFFHKFKRENNSQIKGYSQSALNAMSHHNWPGNVRELINHVRRALVMSEHKYITAADMGLEEHDETPLIMTLEQARASAELDMIKKGLTVTGNNISRAARTLGVSRVTLYHLMDKHHLR
ncbi:MAG: sigma 54-interacting transcriptional regulator [Amphritea sp.]